MTTGEDRSYIVALGFGTTVAAWAVAYVCRLPAVMAPSWLVGALLLVCLAGGGFAAGRWTGEGMRAGLWVGVTSAFLDLLILGSALTAAGGGRLAPTAWLWLPGWLVLGGALGAAGGAAGILRAGAEAPPRDWTALFAQVAAAATFLLVIAGGLVTSKEAGLAVVDWPNSFGYNMFLYPLSRMTGGIYYEHAHRLFGSLVGLTTVVLAILLWRVDHRRWVRNLGVVAVAAVVVQGVLGGLRVTGHLTMSASTEVTRPSLGLAIVHGVFGQLFFALMVGLAIVTSVAWRNAGAAEKSEGSGTDRALQGSMLLALLLQLGLGALQRHLAAGLWIHITMAAVVATLGAAVAVRIFGFHSGIRPLGRLAKLLLTALSIQLVLGLAALAATGGVAVQGEPGVLAVTLATAHQACGALLLAATLLLVIWTRKRLA